jgi:hypothetical protein
MAEEAEVSNFELVLDKLCMTFIPAEPGERNTEASFAILGLECDDHFSPVTKSSHVASEVSHVVCVSGKGRFAGCHFWHGWPHASWVGGSAVAALGFGDGWGSFEFLGGRRTGAISAHGGTSDAEEERGPVMRRVEISDLPEGKEEIAKQNVSVRFGFFGGWCFNFSTQLPWKIEFLAWNFGAENNEIF